MAGSGTDMSVMDDPEPDEAQDPDIRHVPDEDEDEAVQTSDPADVAPPPEDDLEDDGT